MTSYEFTLKLNREVTDDEIDALYEAGCDDAGIETGPLGTVAYFSREAPSLAEAIVSAARDIDKVPGLRAVGVKCDNMVTLLDIAKRAGVSREAVRLWAAGQRGPGGFPKPFLVTTGGEKLWDREQVTDWLEQYQRRTTVVDIVHTTDMPPGDVSLRIMMTADRVLAAREALRSEPDDDVRQEFERLLEDA
jgi:hypothetical protein